MGASEVRPHCCGMRLPTARLGQKGRLAARAGLLVGLVADHLGNRVRLALHLENLLRCRRENYRPSRPSVWEVSSVWW